MEAATLSTKFQVVIPKAIREEMGLKPGQRLVFIPKGKVPHLVVPTSLADFIGIARDKEPTGFRDRTDRVDAGSDR